MLLLFALPPRKRLPGVTGMFYGAFPSKNALFDTSATKLSLTACGIYTIAQIREVSVCIILQDIVVFGLAI